MMLSPKRSRWGFDAILLDESPNAGGDYQRWLLERGWTKPAVGYAHGVPPNGWIARPSHLPEHLSFESWVTDNALRFLETRDPDAPFFLCLGYFAPHPPLTPPRVHFERYAGSLLPAPAIGDCS